MRRILAATAVLATLVAMPAFAASPVEALGARDVLGPPAVVPLDREEAPARIVADQPVAAWLKEGRVVIQYRAENLRIQPVFGPAALAVTPRIGHIHVTVDDAPFRWADASGEPLIINKLPPGPHRVTIDLVNANHQPLDSTVVSFVIPERLAAERQAHQH